MENMTIIFSGIRTEVSSNGANPGLSEAVLENIGGLIEICNNFAKNADTNDPEAASVVIKQFKGKEFS